jgi:hypothetical protein
VEGWIAVSEILTIARYRWRGIRNDLTQSPSQRAWAVALIALNLAGALFSYHGFAALLAGWASVGDEQLWARSTLLLLGILLAAYFLGLVSAAKEFLGHNQASLLLVAPVRSSSLIWAKYLAVLADRNLEIVVVVLGAPLLAAMQGAELVRALSLLPLLLAAVLLANMVAVATVLLAARYVWQRWKLVLGLGASFVVLLVTYSLSIVRNDHLGTETVFDALGLWPTALTARPFLPLVVLPLALLLICWGLARFLSRIYRFAWSQMQETRLAEKRPAGRSRQSTSAWLLHRLLPWQGALRAILLKEWRMMARSPLFPIRMLALFLSWIIFPALRAMVGVHDPLLTVPLAVAYVLFCLQATVLEPTANAFAGEGERLTLTLTAPLSPRQIMRAKLVAHWFPALLSGVASTFVIGMLLSLPLPTAGFAVLMTFCIVASNVTLLVGGSVVATDLSVSISGVLEEILFEETLVAPITAYRMTLMGISITFQVVNVLLLCLPYWQVKQFGSTGSVFWWGLAALFLAINGLTALGAWRVGVTKLNRLSS